MDSIFKIIKNSFFSKKKKIFFFIEFFFLIYALVLINIFISNSKHIFLYVAVNNLHYSDYIKIRENNSMR